MKNQLTLMPSPDETPRGVEIVVDILVVVGGGGGWTSKGAVVYIRKIAIMPVK